MGSWSEQCDISGLEIREGDECYVCLISKGVNGTYGVYTPPIKGTYADYGRLAIDPKEDDYRRFWGVVTGGDDDDDMEWEPRNADGDILGDVDAFWISDTAYDTFSSLIRDYSFSNRNGTIGDDVRDSVAELRKTIVAAEEKRKSYELLGDDKYDILWTYDITRACDRTFVNRESMLIEHIKTGLPLDHYFEGYERAMTLLIAVNELRTCLRPHDLARGPQHGGEKALAAFYEAILAEAASRIEAARRDEEEEPEED